jgi:hypothetical protein
VTATILAGEGEPPPPPPVGEVQTRAQRHCLNGLADAAVRVARAQADDAGECLHAFARGRVERLGLGAQTRTAEACLTNDVTGRVARALDRTLRRDTNRCRERPEQLPDFAYRGAGPVNVAARGQTAALAEDLFGPLLDDVLEPAKDSPGSAACQEAVADASGEVLDAGARVAADAQRDALRGRRRQAVDSALELETALLSGLARDAGGRLTRARTRLQRDVVDACVGTEQAFTALFPGVCAGAVGTGELAACVDRTALCRLCRAQNGMGGLALDCDGFDDGVPNLTCP